MLPLHTFNNILLEKILKDDTMYKLYYFFKEDIMEKIQTKNVKVVNADPSALGLFGLAMVTLVASSQKLGLTTGLSFVIPWALFLVPLHSYLHASMILKGTTLLGQQLGGYAFFWMGMAAS